MSMQNQLIPIRGGSWDDNQGNARVAVRYGVHPNYRNDDLGVRLARSIPVTDDRAVLCNRRAVRGGSWDFNQDYARATYCSWSYPGNRDVNLGVRLTRSTPVRKPIEPVLRGGSWFAGARCLRSAYRSANPPGDRDGSLGFRLARSIPKTSYRFVLRGGSWLNYQALARAAARDRFHPGYRYYALGVRLARKP